MNRTQALQIDPRDNVAVALSDIKEGESVRVITQTTTFEIRAKANIDFGHKVALVDFEPHMPIIKYGEEIGKTIGVIANGDWVHVHNVYCERGR